jgi:hypothetical protein
MNLCTEKSATPRAWGYSTSFTEVEQSFHNGYPALFYLLNRAEGTNTMRVSFLRILCTIFRRRALLFSFHWHAGAKHG